ncbi:MAG: helix-turn-helix domain-containing protein [Defluviitaleaceae bacterium]|nr:helix-turn-helix domain-containing protein [Defluviitaleaceae bacterium]
MENFENELFYGFDGEKFTGFGGNLKKIRKDRGFTAKELASFIRVSPSYIALIEKGHRRPSLATFLRICKFFDESPETMLEAPASSLRLRESGGTFNEKSEKRGIQRSTIMGMLEVFNEKELDYIIAKLKAFKDFAHSDKA